MVTQLGSRRGELKPRSASLLSPRSLTRCTKLPFGNPAVVTSLGLRAPCTELSARAGTRVFTFLSS